MKSPCTKILLTALLICIAAASLRAETTAGLKPEKERRERPVELAGIELDTVAGKPMFPVFGPFRDNYIILGSNTCDIPTKYTVDIKFQFSLAVRLWYIKKHNVDVLFTYTQRCYWDAFQYSSPFRENNFNPGLWFAWRVRHNTALMFGFEHESNGLGDDNSRSWNYASVACIWDPLQNWRFGGHLWYGYYDMEKCPEWFRYRGIGRIWATYHTRNDRISASLMLNPSDWFRKCNVQAEFSWKMAKRGSFLPRLFVQYYGGFCDGMIPYKKYASMVRVGVSFSNNRMTMF